MKMYSELDHSTLIQQADYSIDDGDRALAGAHRGDGSGSASVARAHYARAATLIQLAHYLAMSEDSEKRWAAIDAAMFDESLSLEERMHAAGFSDDDIKTVYDRIERSLQDSRIGALDEAHARDEATR